MSNLLLLMPTVEVVLQYRLKHLQHRDNLWQFRMSTASSTETSTTSFTDYRRLQHQVLTLAFLSKVMQRDISPCA